MDKIKLDDTQKEAIISAFKNKITVITGAAGTGKSLICKYIVEIAHKAGLTIRLMSPTGKASQVLSEKTNYSASTIHRSLKMRPGSDFPGELIKEDLIIVDEVSMCGIDTMYAIMVALENSPNTKIILVGDKNQLPSVSAGNFLSDIMQAKCANVVTLNKIHRQDEKSFISLIANEISSGKVTEIPNDATDVKWHIINADTFDNDLLKFVDNYISSGKNMDDLQFISPMKKGGCGVFYVNKLIQDKMAGINNTKEKYIQVGFNKFHLGDRVIQTENNYEKNIFNGDMGKIVDIGEKVLDSSSNDKKSRFISVDFVESSIITYIGNDIEELALSWCNTVHKMQGSQFPNVVMIIANEQGMMMSRELVYTAMTRPSKQLDIFGHINAWRSAPSKSSVKKRYTNMVKIIKSKQENKKYLMSLEEKVN